MLHANDDCRYSSIVGPLLNNAAVLVRATHSLQAVEASNSSNGNSSSTGFPPCMTVASITLAHAQHLLQLQALEVQRYPGRAVELALQADNVLQTLQKAVTSRVTPITSAEAAVLETLCTHCGSSMKPVSQPLAVTTNTVLSNTKGNQLDSGGSAIIVSGSKLPYAIGQNAARTAVGLSYVLEDGSSSISLSDALMWQKVCPFSPLNTGCVMQPF
jgi:hypothetical protein